MDDRQLAHHRRLNLETREAWQWFASHRQRVTTHLTSQPAKSLAVWGAGNCNDLDLACLLEHFQQICLFDLDVAAVEWGIRQQQAIDRARIKVIQADAVEWATRCLDGLPQFETVASTCLLSQILHFAQRGIVGEALATWPRLEMLRHQHLRLLLRMTRPGGCTLFFNDFLSSDTCSELSQCDEVELAGLLQRELSRQNFFTGLNPLAVARTLEESTELHNSIAEMHLTSPWQWNLGPHRCYAVCLHRMLRA